MDFGSVRGSVRFASCKADRFVVAPITTNREVPTQMRVVYLSGSREAGDPAILRTGEAGYLIVEANNQFSTETRVQLSANSTHALLGHGVVDALNELPIQGRVGRGRDVIIPPGELHTARRVFYAADAKTYGQDYEFVVDEPDEGGESEKNEDGEEVEYRIKIDNREYQHALSGLQYLLSTASSEGIAVWIRI